MIYPSAECANFCNWLLNTGSQKLSGPQRIIVQTVFTAALNGSGIDDQDWYNFNLFTSWRYPIFTSWWSLQSQPVSAFVSGILADYLAACAAAGATAPSNDLQNRILKAFSFAENAGIINSLDVVYLFAVDAISQVTVPVYSAVSVSPSVSGSLGFTANFGIYSIAGSYYNSGYTPSTSALNLSLDNAFIGGRCLTPAGIDGAICGAQQSFPSSLIRLIPRSSANVCSFSLNDFSPSSVSNVSPVSSVYVARNSSTSRFLSSGSGFNSNAGATSVALPNRPLFICCFNNVGSPASFFTNPIGCITIGSVPSSEALFSTFTSLLCGY